MVNSENLLVCKPLDLLVPDEHVGDSLVLAEQGDAEEDFHVGSLPQLLVVGGLLNQVQDLAGEGLLSQGVGLGVQRCSVSENEDDF